MCRGYYVGALEYIYICGLRNVGKGLVTPRPETREGASLYSLPLYKSFQALYPRDPILSEDDEGMY